jgi:hypothetical protein
VLFTSSGKHILLLKGFMLMFHSHCDDLHRVEKVPLEVVKELRKILGAKDQAAVDKWHRYCAIQTDTAVQSLLQSNHN